MMQVIRKKILVEGIVQGVGFRPFVYRLAVGMNLKGFVSNTSYGVEIQVEGDAHSIESFQQILQSEVPVLAKITEIKEQNVSPIGEPEFLIRSSQAQDEQSALISPDISICNDCLKELFDPGNRRYRYPFINCTNCGPRYTIIRDIPYDRPGTTMVSFHMCTECQQEYDDPANRRFHAQPNACPVCGPSVLLTNPEGTKIKTDDPIFKTIQLLKEGKIVAIKGLGGFHLACDATNEKAVLRLRKRKKREEKPLAVMAPDLDMIRNFARLSPKEKDLLASPRRPIVLLEKKKSTLLADSVAPANQYVGVMLPYTPLHYLLFREKFSAVVMTSGNLSEEPIAIGRQEALDRLRNIADFFLMHDRGIHLRCDDSVMRIVGELPRHIRRSRGFVPVPVFLRNTIPSILAVGGELKNTICVTKDERAFISQHVGDLENVESLHFMEECVDHLVNILQIEPQIIAHDLHPDYLSTRWALDQSGIRKTGVQHHHAHIASCLAENGFDTKVIGLSMDGTGYGTDGHIWGGEILLADLNDFARMGHFVYRPMPGGVAAIKEPWRMAIAYLYAACLQDGDDENMFYNKLATLPLFEMIDQEKIDIILQVIRKGKNLTMTSSLGRLFDGAASLVGLKQQVAFEGQAAMEFEMAMKQTAIPEALDTGYPFRLVEEGETYLLDMDRTILQMVNDVSKGIPVSEISFRFHMGLVRLFIHVCKKLRTRTGIFTIALSGGCFQNRFLLEVLSHYLGKAGFHVLTHSQVPTNDGGLSLGQAVIAAKR